MTKIRVILSFIIIVSIFLTGCTDRSITGNGPVSTGPGNDLSGLKAGKIPAGETITTAPVQDIGSCIRDTFPDLTEGYTAIKTAIHDLNWNEAQNRSLDLEGKLKAVKNMCPSPDTQKNMNGKSDDKQRIILDKYRGYLNNLEQYAIYQKDAIYYRTSSTDQSAKGTAKRNQDLADEYEKKVVTDVRTLDEYCREFKYDYLDSLSVTKYSFIK